MPANMPIDNAGRPSRGQVLFARSPMRVFVTALVACALAANAFGADVRALDKPAAGLPPLRTLDDSSYSLKANRGQVRVLNFWAAWCAPCREEMPALEKYAKSMSNQPVEVVLVNVGDSPKVIREFLKKVPLNVPVVRDVDSAMPHGAWNLTQLPATMVIDRHDTARWVTIGKLDAFANPVRKQVSFLLSKP